jgi:hypothetical protein
VTAFAIPDDVRIAFRAGDAGGNLPAHFDGHARIVANVPHQGRRGPGKSHALMEDNPALARYYEEIRLFLNGDL